MLSPARPSSSSLRNISTPVTMVFIGLSRMPTISISSPTLTMPRSTRPVATVPRPVMVKTSSTGIRNGLSMSRSGSGRYVSSASMSSMMLLAPLAVVLAAAALERLEGRALDDGELVARELVLAEQLADLHLDQLDELGVVDEVDLVHVDDDVRHVDLVGEQDVLAGLRHGAVVGAHDEDGGVHLGGAGDHVLDVVGVARAVDVRVVALLGLVLDVRGGDGDAALALFRRLVDHVERGELGVADRGCAARA